MFCGCALEFQLRKNEESYSHTLSIAEHQESWMYEALTVLRGQIRL